MKKILFPALCLFIFSCKHDTNSSHFAGGNSVSSNQQSGGIPYGCPEDALSIVVNRPVGLDKGKFSLFVIQASTNHLMTNIRGPNGTEGPKMGFGVSGLYGGRYIVEIWSEGLRQVREVIELPGGEGQCVTKTENKTYNMIPVGSSAYPAPTPAAYPMPTMVPSPAAYSPTPKAFGNN